MISLHLLHQISLTKEERYSLHEGNTVETVAVCVPVWEIQEGTNEPAQELFCKYVLTNPRQEQAIRTLPDKSGFLIPIPYRPGEEIFMSDEKYRYYSLEKPDKLWEFYDTHVSERTSKNLLDLPEGCGFLCYGEYLRAEKLDMKINVMHRVVISNMERLVGSLV